MWQVGEDWLLKGLFFHNYTAPGVFLEIGALDGEKVGPGCVEARRPTPHACPLHLLPGSTYSNSWHYEWNLGWKGILVEAQPTNAAAMLKSNRPRTAKFAMAVCPINSDSEPGSVIMSASDGPVAAARYREAHMQPPLSAELDHSFGPIYTAGPRGGGRF